MSLNWKGGKYITHGFIWTLKVHFSSALKQFSQSSQKKLKFKATQDTLGYSFYANYF